jgi:hypothetical protein
MAKLYEIENYLEKKIRKTTWARKEFILFNPRRGVWYNQSNKIYSIDASDIEHDNWEEYTEPETPKVRRLWQWIIYNKDGYRPDQYLDDSGVTCSGLNLSSVWEKISKVKIEKEWIEINQNGELVNWAGKNE